MGLFSVFRSSTPPPLYLHGIPGATDSHLSPLPSATHPSIHSGPGRHNARLRACEEVNARVWMVRREEQIKKFHKQAERRNASLMAGPLGQGAGTREDIKDVRESGGGSNQRASRGSQVPGSEGLDAGVARKAERPRQSGWSFPTHFPEEDTRRAEEKIRPGCFPMMPGCEADGEELGVERGHGHFGRAHSGYRRISICSGGGFGVGRRGCEGERMGRMSGLGRGGGFVEGFGRIPVGSA